MNAQALASAKISSPLVPGDVLLRERLFELLDSGRSKPVIWVSGLAGSGKTTLVSSYTGERDIPGHWYRVDAGDSDPAGLFYYLGLAGKKAAPRRKKGLPLFTPEYAMGLDRFAQRFFEDLFTRLKAPGLLVFDNVQEVSDESLFHQVILEGVSRIPEGLSIVLVSRSDPPPAYSRLVANREIEVIKGDRMRLDMDEFRAILESHGHSDLADTEAAELNDRVDGWMAGVVLMLGSGGPEGFAPSGEHGETAGELFDYFASEIWDLVDEELRDFLMKTSYLPAMTSKMAEELSGTVRAGRILSDLSRQNQFTVRLQRSPVQFQYHPLFTDYLKTRSLEHFTTEDLCDLQIAAALILAGSGQVEEAVKLLVDAQSWPNTVELILSQAQGMVMQGRVQTLLGWIEAVPEQLIEEIPWLAYWKGICLFQMARPGNRDWLLKAWSGFKANGDRAGSFLSLAIICESGFYQWLDMGEADNWIDELKLLLEEDGEYPSPEIEGMVVSAVLLILSYKRPYPVEIKPWQDRAVYLAGQSPDFGLRIKVNLLIANYYAWTGDFEKFTNCFRAIKQGGENENLSPFDQINIFVFEAMNNWLTGDIAGCREIVNKGLEYINDTGIHAATPYLITQMTYAALCSGEADEAGKHLDNYQKMFHPSNQLHSAHYHFLAGWLALVRGDLTLALSEMKLSVIKTVEGNLPYPRATNMVGRANACIETGDHDRADKLLNEAHVIGERMESRQLRFMCQAAWAYMALKKADEEDLREHLKLMTAAGKELVFTNVPMWRPPVMSQLYAKALEYEIEVNYVREIIRKHKLVPSDPLHELESWPWPLRIYTMGRFEVVREDEPLRFTGKAQQRPIALLKAILAFGGRDVKEEQIVDALWPDADGDAGHQAFTTNLHRLRKFIDVPDAVLFSNGRVTINPEVCWVDRWALERSLGDAESVLKQSTPSIEEIRSAERGLNLYTGHFLAPDIHKNWAVSPREKVRSRFTHIVKGLGRKWEDLREWERAAELYLKALHVDDLAEDVYRRLMLCYHELGHKAEAISAYQRCVKVLSSVLGLEVSAETRRLYDEIVNSR